MNPPIDIPGSRYRLSHHAMVEMTRRGIPLDIVKSVLELPEQVVPAITPVTCHQSRIAIEGKMYLLRVMVNEEVFPPVIVTVYRTSRIGKYWEAGT